jgi:hypothetical protein
VSIFILVCGYVSPTGAGDEFPQTVMSPLNATVVAPSNSSTIFVAHLDVPIAVQGWEESKNGCFYNAGTWTVETPPVHGAVTFETTFGADDACGAPLPFNTLFYTWTDAGAKITALDHVTATWTSDDGMFSGGGTFTFVHTLKCHKNC